MRPNARGTTEATTTQRGGAERAEQNMLMIMYYFVVYILENCGCLHWTRVWSVRRKEENI